MNQSSNFFSIFEIADKILTQKCQAAIQTFSQAGIKPFLFLFNPCNIMRTFFQRQVSNLRETLM